MAVVSSSADVLSDNLAVFYTTDPLLSDSPILAFYGASTTSVANPANNCRIQCHILAAAGLRSYPRLAVSPGSALYQAVNCLLREEQGDEVCRGLAFSLLKYFTDLPEPAKSAWIEDALSADRPSSALKLFTASHAANLASHMQQLGNGPDVIRYIRSALTPRSISFLDADLILPLGSIKVPTEDGQSIGTPLQNDDIGFRYGQYACLVRQFGDETFIPTSRMRRAPSKSTSISHSTRSSPEQRSQLWREMCELATTEENYVQKIEELIHVLGEDLHQGHGSVAENPRHRNDVVSSSLKNLEKILSLNGTFLRNLQDVLQAQNHTSPTQEHKAATEEVTSLDLMPFARCLHSSISQFRDSYEEYMKAYPRLIRRIKDVLAEPESGVRRPIVDVGERKLLSMLIEPVQRLPRYNLYIDDMLKCLPIDHIGTKLFLSTKDLVSAICSPDSTSIDHARLSRLEVMVRSWPSTLPGTPRLVTAVDAVELRLPYDVASTSNLESSSILLLFTNCLVALRRHSQSSATARTLLAELDSSIVRGPQPDGQGLSVSAWWMLHTINFDELHGSTCIMISPSAASSSPTTKMQATRSCASIPQTQVFRLSSMNDGQTKKLMAEVAKARIEDRHSEAFRESSMWEARSWEPDTESLGLVTAIFEDHSHSSLELQPRSASLRILVEPDKRQRLDRSSQSNGEILAIISAEGQGIFQLEIVVIHERPTCELVNLDDLRAVLLRRVTNILQMRHQIRNPATASHLLQQCQTLLRHLQTQLEHGQQVSRAIRSHSPVKVIANLFSGTTSSKDTARETVTSQQSPTMTEIPQFAHSAQQTLKAYPSITKPGNHAREDSKVSLIDFDLKRQNPHIDLEALLKAYVSAIQARKADVSGKTVSRRTLAPKVEVNELYNILLQSSANLEKAAQVSIDVLFAAFENFLMGAWKQEMGPILSEASLAKLEVASTMSSSDERYQHFAIAMRQLAPQNQRAVRVITELLAELLSEAKDDGDKGLLMAAFAELLFQDRNSRDFIPLLDQLLEFETAKTKTVKKQKSIISANAVSDRLAQTSLSSKASSISKRFGFGSLRKAQSKADLAISGSKRRKTVDDEEAAVDNGFDNDSRHVDAVSQRTPQDKHRHHAENMPDEQDCFTLDPIAVSPFAANINPFNSPMGLRKARPLSTTAMVPVFSTSLKLGSPSKLPRPQSLYATAAKDIPSLENGSKFKCSAASTAPILKTENTSSVEVYATIRTRPPQLDLSESRSKLLGTNESNSTNLLSPPEKRTAKKSPSPGLRGVLCERNNHEDPAAQPFAPVKHFVNAQGSPVKKLRIKSPQKAHQQVSATVSGTETKNDTLKEELASLTKLLTSLSQKQNLPEVTGIAARLQDLSNTISSQVTGAPHATIAMSNSITDSAATERTIKQLKGQLTQADNENAALYDRTNKELMGVFEQVRGGNGVEQLRQRLAEEMNEAKKWREEAKRLRTENAMLRLALDKEEESENRTVMKKPLAVTLQKITQENAKLTTEDVPFREARNAEKEESPSSINDTHDHNDITRTKENEPPVSLRAQKSMSIMGRGRPIALARDQ